ncbi:Hsp20/alpha crystallin family protein [Roseovarius pacificus]|uniref:Hsp20/alpha crystallin family protein n=1 Tax=Roseovarius pacificus TaxID=337701 RepID=UPI002A18DCD7|nr:Hsp20/alpha crystallin family protein [Roseovarius pacificus]
MKENTVATRNDQVAADTRAEERTLVPPVDIFETEEGLVVVADLPGVNKDGVSIDVADGVLTIRGNPGNGLRGDAVRHEFALRPFFRQFQLSDTVDQERISAEMRHGVLTIHLPKVAAKQPKKIAVSVAS